MKACVKATGEIVEVYLYGKEGYDYVCNDKEEVYERSELEILDDPDYWTRLEHTYAGMAMQGILGNQTYTKNLLETSTSAKDARYIIVDASMYLAHALVEKLKEKEDRK